jgi:uncharacterized protein (TIGR02466 family)
MISQLDYLFPTPIGIYNLLDNSLCEKYSNLILNDYRSQIINKTSTAITTRDDLHNQDVFKGIIEIINPIVDDFSEEILGLEKNSLMMTAMWSNIRYSGSKHHVHQHPNSFLSGVLYLSVSESIDPGNIFFVDPRPAKNMFHGIFTKQSPISDRTWWYIPKTGVMLLFPSWLEHGTDEYLCSSNNPRISLSFNFVLNKFISH